MQFRHPTAAGSCYVHDMLLQVLEEGTHKALVERNGYFAHLLEASQA